MSRSTSLLLAALAASLLVNVVLVMRPARPPRPADAPTAPTAPRPSVAAPADRPGPVEIAPPGHPTPAAPPAADRRLPDRLAAALSEQETWDRFWTALHTLNLAGESLEPAEYRAHVLESTADFLAVDRASFAAIVAQVLASIDAINAEGEYDGSVELDFQAIEARERQGAARLEAARAPLRALLAPDANRMHKRFLAHFPEWEAVLRTWGP